MTLDMSYIVVFSNYSNNSISSTNNSTSSIRTLDVTKPILPVLHDGSYVPPCDWVKWKIEKWT